MYSGVWLRITRIGPNTAAVLTTTPSIEVHFDRPADETANCVVIAFLMGSATVSRLGLGLALELAFRSGLVLVCPLVLVLLSAVVSVYRLALAWASASQLVL